MPAILKFVARATAQLAAYAGALAEIRFDTDKKTIVAFDGAQAGGFPLLREDHANDPRFPAHVAGRFYFGVASYPNAGNAVAVNRIYTTVFFCPRRQAFTKIGCKVTTANAGAKVRLGIYKIASGYPAALVAGSDAGEIDASSTGDKEVTIAVTLDAGYYVLALITNDAAIQVSNATGPNQSVWMHLFGYEDTGPTAYAGNGARCVDNAYGALPATFPASWTTTNAFWPLLWLRL